jgi:uncharacterized protein
MMDTKKLTGKSVVFCCMAMDLLVLFTLGCSRHKLETETYRIELEKWRSGRLEDLKAANGWLNLAGLYWLNPGMNTFGSDSSSSLVFPPKAPRFIGTIELRGDSVYLRTTTQPVLIDSIPASNVILTDDAFGKPTRMMLYPFVWNVIKRGSRYGIRLRDLNSPLTRKLESIPHFEPDEHYRIVAKFKPYSTPEKLKVQTIIGTEEESLVPGELHFKLDGKSITLYPFVEDRGLFLVFGDLSNGDETYPAGRFLYMEMPREDNLVILDFNKAYNPPCAFTPFATCPLPVRKNIIPVSIKAGEKAVHLTAAH